MEPETKITMAIVSMSLSVMALIMATWEYETPRFTRLHCDPRCELVEYRLARGQGTGIAWRLASPNERTPPEIAGKWFHAFSAKPIDNEDLTTQLDRWCESNPKSKIQNPQW